MESLWGNSCDAPNIGIHHFKIKTLVMSWKALFLSLLGIIVLQKGMLQPLDSHLNKVFNICF